MRKTIVEVLLCICLALFCLFGFAASFEPNSDPVHAFKTGYGIVGVLAIGVAMLRLVRAVRR